MAAKTTSAAGVFTDGTKWGGGVAPVTAADTLTINHAMTWAPSASSSFTIGTGSGVALTFGSSGSLTITGAGAFTLTFAGSTAGGNTSGYELTINATNGDVLVYLDATGNAAGFNMITGGTYSATNLGGWLLNGNANYDIEVASLPSDATKNSYFTSGGQYGGGVVNGSYFRLTRVGQASTTNAYTPALDNRLRTLSWDHVTLDACGEIALSGDSTYTGTVSFSHVKSTNTATDGWTKFPINIGFNGATGDKTFTDCVWDKTVKFGNVKKLSMPRNLFKNGWSGTSVTHVWDGLSGCFIRQTYDSLLTSGNVSNSFLYYDSSAGSNPHWLAGSTPTGTAAVDWIDNTIYFNGSNAAGNVFTLPSSSNGSLTYKIKRNLVLRNRGGTSSGTLVTANGNVTNGYAIEIEHNTAYVGGSHAVEIGHFVTVAETPNRYSSFKSNMFVGDGTGYKAFNVDGTPTNDFLAPANATHNGSYNITLVSGTAGFTNEGKGYASKFTATPGANDVDGVDPNFVDGNATLATWAVSKGSAAGTTLLQEADAVNFIEADTSLIADLMAYLAAAYRPRAQAFKATAHDGGDIGAFAVQLSSAVYMTGGGEGPAFGFLEA